MPDDARPILVATCGNGMAGDDGVGPAVAEALREGPIEGVDVVDAGESPGAMVQQLAGHRRLIVVDAIVDPDRAPGELVEVDWFAHHRPELLDLGAVSSHAWCVAHEVELARALGTLPEEVFLLGVCVRSAAVGRQALSPEVARGVRHAVARIREAAEHLSEEEAEHDEQL